MGEFEAQITALLLTFFVVVFPIGIILLTWGLYLYADYRRKKAYEEGKKGYEKETKTP